MLIVPRNLLLRTFGCCCRYGVLLVVLNAFALDLAWPRRSAPLALDGRPSTHHVRERALFIVVSIPAGALILPHAVNTQADLLQRAAKHLRRPGGCHLDLGAVLCEELVDNPGAHAAGAAGALPRLCLRESQKVVS